MTKSEMEEVLLEAELIVMSVNYDLARWEQELEVAKYAKHLDRIIDWQFDKPVEDLQETVPLVVYTTKGERIDVGIAKVSLVTGDVMASFTNEHYASLIQSQPKGSFSIGFDQDRRGMRVKPVPYSKLEQYQRETEELAKITGLLPANAIREALEEHPFFKEAPHVDRPEDYRPGGERPHRLPQLLRRRNQVQPGGGAELRPSAGSGAGGAAGQGPVAGEVPPAS